MDFVPESVGLDLQDQEKKLRIVLESIPNGIIMVDRSGCIVLANPEVEKMFGYDPGELIGSPVEKLVPGRFRDSHPKYRNRFIGHPTKRKMGEGRDLTGQRKDGSEIPVEIGLNHVQTDEGMFIVASVVDITERKGIEDKLHLAYEEVQQKNHEMEQFVYTVSHDLKAPLVTSMSFIGFLREDLQEQRMDDVLDSLDRLEKAHGKMQSLLQDLLQLSRVGRMELEPEMLDLKQVISDISDFASAKQNGWRFELEIQSGAPSFWGDRKRVLQVFENLISNASKYGITETSRKIQVIWQENESEIRFAVKDFGPGIDPQYHKKIFGLFQRLSNDKEGTGVGLAIVSRVMQMHGGRAWVVSSPGKGAEFWISFPKKKGEAHA